MTDALDVVHWSRLQLVPRAPSPTPKAVPKTGAKGAGRQQICPSPAAVGFSGAGVRGPLDPGLRVGLRCRSPSWLGGRCTLGLLRRRVSRELGGSGGVAPRWLGLTNAGPAWLECAPLGRRRNAASYCGFLPWRAVAGGGHLETCQLLVKQARRQDARHAAVMS